MNRIPALLLTCISLAILFLSLGSSMPLIQNSNALNTTHAVPSVNNQPIICVFLSSSLPGQPQYLSVPDNTSGALLYPDLSIQLISSSVNPYNVYVGGKDVLAGNVSGVLKLSYSIPSGVSSISISISVGNQVFNYPNELVSSISISKYYGPKPQPYIYTASAIEEELVKGFVSAIFGVFIAMFFGRKYILEKEKREAIFI